MSSEVNPEQRPFVRRNLLTRASQASAVERRAAKAVTADIAERMGRWHLEIARLRGLVEYRRSRGLDPEVRSEIDTLASNIQRHRTAFIEAVNHLPPKVASSGWITDIDRVLCRAAEVVETLRATDVSPMQ